MSLENRWSACLPVLRFALRDELAGIALTIRTDQTIVIHADGDSTGFGFVEGLPGESMAEAALRLLDILADTLPGTRRCWGRQVLRCELPGHRHWMGLVADNERSAVVLTCPDAPTVPLHRIDLPDQVRARTAR
jgi:hypothetical protein